MAAPRKTDSLAVPSDPLAALRALQDLDARPPSPPQQTPAGPATALPPTGVTGSGGAPDTGSPVGSAGGGTPAGARDSAPAQRRAGADGSANDRGGGPGGPAASEADSAEPRGGEGTDTALRAPRPRKPDPAWPEEKPVDPMADAVRAMLARPYTTDPEKGPFTVSTVKIPAEVWERLGWLSKWTGRAKQDIIADALKDHFAKVVKGR